MALQIPTTTPGIANKIVTLIYLEFDIILSFLHLFIYYLHYLTFTYLNHLIFVASKQVRKYATVKIGKTNIINLENQSKPIRTCQKFTRLQLYSTNLKNDIVVTP